MFVLSTPQFNPQFKNQQQVSSISEEDFQKGIRPLKASISDRLIQVFQFIFFLGWLKLPLFLLSFLTLLLSVVPITFEYYLFHTTKYLYTISQYTFRFIFRVMYLCLGIYKINIKGKKDENARVYTFNHTTIIDGPLVFILFPYSPIIMIKVKSIPYIGRICEAAESIFIDRSSKFGNADLISKAVEDPTRPPIVLAPEGMTTMGYYLLKFRTGAFLTNKKVQPLAITYRCYGAYAGVGYRWKVGKPLEWLWRTCCVPFGTVTIEYLPSVSEEELLPLTPDERATKFQLMTANALGIQATDRSTREILTKKEEDLKKEE